MSSDWYAKKLGQQPSTNRAPATTPRPQPQTAAPQYSSAPVADDDEYRPTKATSLRQTERCPECDGANYGSFNSPMGMKSKPRCYDCGYPALHTTSGVSIPNDTPGQAARQVSTANNYNPQIIVDRIG